MKECIWKKKKEKEKEKRLLAASVAGNQLWTPLQLSSQVDNLEDCYFSSLLNIQTFQVKCSVMKSVLFWILIKPAQFAWMKHLLAMKQVM